MKVIIFGASGMIGKGVLLECLDDCKVELVTCIGRSSTGLSNSKLKEVIHSNFEDFSAIEADMKDHDACFFCLGVSAGGMTENDYRKITYDFTLSAAKTLVRLNPQMTFTYISGQGTDSTEKGRMMWARVKGKVENDLMALGFNKAIMFRPGGIIPLRGIKSRTAMYQFMYDYFTWLLRLIEWVSPNSITDTTRIGRAMINAHEFGLDGSILSPKEINALAASKP